MHAIGIKQYLAHSLFVMMWMHAMHVHELYYIVTSIVASACRVSPPVRHNYSRLPENNSSMHAVSQHALLKKVNNIDIMLIHMYVNELCIQDMQRHYSVFLIIPPSIKQHDILHLKSCI